MGLGLILRKRLEDACQGFRNRAFMKTGKMAAPPESFPHEIDNLTHPNLFENIGWLQIAGHAGEQLAISCSILALEERRGPKIERQLSAWDACVGTVLI